MMNNYETVYGIDRCHADSWITWKQNIVQQQQHPPCAIDWHSKGAPLSYENERNFFFFLLFRGLVMKLQIIHNFKELCKNEPLILIRNIPSFQLGPKSLWGRNTGTGRNSPASPSLMISLPPPPWPTSMCLCWPDCLSVHYQMKVGSRERLFQQW